MRRFLGQIERMIFRLLFPPIYAPRSRGPGHAGSRSCLGPGHTGMNPKQHPLWDHWTDY